MSLMEECLVNVDVGEKQFDQFDFVLIEENVDLVGVVDRRVTKATARSDQNLTCVFADMSYNEMQEEKRMDFVRNVAVLTRDRILSASHRRE